MKQQNYQHRRPAFARSLSLALLTLLCFSAAGRAQHGPIAVLRGGAAGGLLSESVSAADEPVIVHTDLVTLRVSVTDRRGAPVLGLPVEAFSVYEDRRPQVVSFFGTDDAPASVAVVFDVSGSMSEEKIARAREALARFVSTSHERDEFFLITFDSSARLLLDKTRDAEALAAKMTYVQPAGQTALYDAIYLGLEKLDRSSHQKRALLVISDGHDNNSRFGDGEARRRLEESGAHFYAIGINAGHLRPTSAEIVGREKLDKLAKISGGQIHYPADAEAMEEAFGHIALDLRHKYVIGYRPANKAMDGAWRKIKVTIDSSPSSARHVVVRAREGYYAPASLAAKTSCGKMNELLLLARRAEEQADWHAERSEAWAGIGAGQDSLGDLASTREPLADFMALTHRRENEKKKREARKIRKAVDQLKQEAAASPLTWNCAGPSA